MLALSNAAVSNNHGGMVSPKTEKWRVKWRVRVDKRLVSSRELFAMADFGSREECPEYALTTIMKPSRSSSTRQSSARISFHDRITKKEGASCNTGF